MRIVADRHIRSFLAILIIVLVTFAVLPQILAGLLYGKISIPLLILSVVELAVIVVLCCVYFRRQDARLEAAADAVKRFLSGQREARIECDEEGELSCLFHSVNALASALNAQRERELQTNEMLKNTVSDISHQLKTPLSSLLVYNELMADSNDLSEIRHFSSASETELERMESLVRNLLKLARLDAGSIVLEKHPENISDLMENLKQRFQCRAEQEEKTITLQGAEVLLLCDASWLSEAFGNILKNALDHTEKGGRIAIVWKRHGTLLHVEVCDNGSGIHPEDLPYIFKRFYRSRYSRDKQGVGLGLPLAKTIVEAHNGVIEVESTPGTGTVFNMDFVIPTKL